MKGHIGKKERKALGTPRKMKPPKAKYLNEPGNKGKDFYVKIIKKGK
jgi:hypothetical protein